MCDLDKHPNYARCEACGQCFTSDSAFDHHLRTNPRARRRENVVKCLDPAEVKRGDQVLVFDQSVGAWRWEPSGEGRRARRSGYKGKRGSPASSRA